MMPLAFTDEDRRSRFSLFHECEVDFKTLFMPLKSNSSSGVFGLLGAFKIKIRFAIKLKVTYFLNLYYQY